MKKCVIVSVIIIFSAIILFALNHNYLLQLSEKKIIKEEILNELNGNINIDANSDIGEYLINNYNRCKKSINELNHYDISKLIDAYINMMSDGIRICMLNKDGHNIRKGEKNEVIRKEKFVRGKDIVMEYNLCYGYTENYSEDDEKSYIDGTYTKSLIDRLKKILDYREENGTIIWEINNINDTQIQLPHNCYIKYTAYHKKDNFKFKKAIDIIFNPNFSVKNRINRIVVRYETFDGNVEEIETNLEYKNGIYYIYTPSVLILEGDNDAKAELYNSIDNIKNNEENVVISYESDAFDDDFDFEKQVEDGNRKRFMDMQSQIKGKTFEDVISMFKDDKFVATEKGMEILKECYDKINGK